MTKAQLKPFWRAVRRAASMLGLVGEEAVEEYRLDVMREEVGAEHAADIDPGDGYDRVMYRLAVDAGDWGAASRFASGSDRRMAHLVEQCARQVVELKAIEEEWSYGDEPQGTRRPEATDYVVGILRQAQVMVVNAGPEWWLDIDGHLSFSVFRMLDTHRRRILRRLCWRGPLAFDPGAEWDHSDGRLFCARDIEPFPSAIRVGKVPA